MPAEPAVPTLPDLSHKPAASAAARLESIDLLRGLVMIVMALDHTRDYFHFGALHNVDPLDLQQTTAPVFLTRWITHFCAPVFSFLAGTSVFLALTRGKTKREMSWFLVTRGLWLVLLELTYVKWAWSFAWDPHLFWGSVIWVLGWSMVALAGLIHLPLRAIAAFGVGLICIHNAFDGIKPEVFGQWGWLWRVAHVRGLIPVADGYAFRAGYSLIPWVGVIAAGYASGALYIMESARRRQWLVRLGAAALIAFVVLRSANVYGNLTRWSPQPTFGWTMLAMLDCTKYPPSLCYLLMTLGPGLLLLAWFERGTPAWLRPAIVYGRVPFFYYMLHIPLIHALAVLQNQLRFGRSDFLTNLWGRPGVPPPEAGVGLAGVYFVWIAVVVALYPACRWFAALKRRRREAWLTYF